MLDASITDFNPLRRGFYLWLLTNLIGDSGWAVCFLYKEKWPIESSELEWASFFAGCILTLSMVIIPFAKILFAYALPLPMMQRLILIGMGLLVLWGLPVLLLAAFVALDFNTNFFNFLLVILPITSSYLAAAYIAALLIYRHWLFRTRAVDNFIADS
ncbi:hypothetical protein [Hymenobacter ruricola]|uniref:DUF2569 family protein n=1 Tax=Hymenobacter ruricola TaxID=2791023 RepID=A0ABS0HYW3_9BACT|nr:hypothetical protein [Hymenobacter ruricola]MBF9219897.1 hypothetical protein [Hymenobacter ruricola]